MKKFIFLIIAFFALIASAAGQVAEPETFKFTWHMAVAIVAGLYEVVVRIIPTVSNYSWIAKIIEILCWISNFLNRKKK